MDGAGEREPVTRERLFRRALEIIDADGLAALTMRRLAADLGVEAASLYHHVANKAAVVDGALEVMRREMVFDEPLPTDWRGIMEVVFLRYLDVLLAHPHLLPLAARHLPSDPAEGLPFLIDSGLDADEAVALWQCVLAFVVGFATFATGQMHGDVAHLDPSLSGRMAHWHKETARLGLRTLLAGAGPHP